MTAPVESSAVSVASIRAPVVIKGRCGWSRAEDWAVLRAIALTGRIGLAEPSPRHEAGFGPARRRPPVPAGT